MSIQQILTIGSKTLISKYPALARNFLLIIYRMITHDIQRFSNHLAAIYSNLAKPTLDVILYNYQLSRNVGAEGLLLLTVLVQSSAALRASSLCFSCDLSLNSLHSQSPYPVLRSLCCSICTTFGLSSPHTFAPR